MLTGINNEIDRKTISLNQGDILIFRGDLIHAGSEYLEENYRIHIFYDSKFLNHISNRVDNFDDYDYQDMILNRI
jgi:hypothetical protein